MLRVPRFAPLSLSFWLGSGFSVASAGEPTGACCYRDEQFVRHCENVTETECFAIPPVQLPRYWEEGAECGVAGQRCPLDACLNRTGSCLEDHSTVGCDDLWCCTDVCQQTFFCCAVEWDSDCAFRAIQNCDLGACCDALAGHCIEVPQADCLPIFEWTAHTTCLDAGCLGACCYRNESNQDVCETLSEAECESRPPLVGPRNWQPGVSCGVPGQRCPLRSCMERPNSCLSVHSTPGCDEPFCCTNVCNIDDFCCLVEWDAVCVELANVLCGMGACCAADGTCAVTYPHECPPESKWIADLSCEQAGCTITTGACCDRQTAECLDGRLLIECAGTFQDWYADTLCADVECQLATGSCCDRSPGLGGVCTPHVLEAECVGEYDVWTIGGFCSLFTCQELTGACCSTLTGTCAEDKRLIECDHNRDIWFPGQTCAQVGQCPLVVGACCDESPGLGGLCTETGRLGCVEPFQIWYESIPCSQVQCVEYIAACCDSLDGVCENRIQGDCLGERETWYQNNHCDTIDCQPALGACCDSRIQDPASNCAQSTRLDCMCEKCQWHENQDCSAIDCQPNFEPIPTVSTWGVVVLALALLIGSKVRRPRRQESGGR